MARLNSSLTVQDTTNSYGCLSGAVPEGKKKYRMKGFDKKEVKKNAMKPIPLDLMKDKITMEKICGLKILKPTTTQQPT